MKRLIAVHTKSSGWLKAFHEVEKGKWLEFVLNNDNTISVSTVSCNPYVDGGFAASLFMNYPMDDVIDYVTSESLVRA